MGAAVVTHGDIVWPSPPATLPNDMVVDAPWAAAYVGNFGYPYPEGELKPAKLALAHPGWPQVSACAEDMVFPNGAVITPDGKTLVVGETFAGKLTAYDIAADGSLSNRRVWAQLPSWRQVPDGCCLDAEGAIWVASPTTNDVLRLAEGGEVLERITAGQGCFACMLGGADRKTLFVLTCAELRPGTRRSRSAPGGSRRWCRWRFRGGRGCREADWESVELQV